MTNETYHHPSRREILSDLFSRLTRVQAAAASLHSLADMHDTATATLADALQSLGHDLLLASRDVDAAATRIGR